MTVAVAERPPRILFVDDEAENCTVFRHAFDRWPIETETAPRRALERLETGDYGVLVTDQRMPDMDGLGLAAAAQARDPELVTVMVTAYTDHELLLTALNEGVLYKFVPKPWDPTAMEGVLERAVAEARRRQAVRRQQQTLERRAANRSEAERRRAEEAEFWDFGDPRMQQLVRDLDRVAASEAAVLILGETGTGKEYFARRVHRLSGRAAGAFVALNCGALAEGLVESELFGHVKGAFTGAVQDRRGRIALASGGTLFLDEVGDLSAAAQATLLRVLQEGAFSRLGDDREQRADCRVIAATHRNLQDEVAAGRFREDLYWRLAQFQVELPALRERGVDIPRWIEFCNRRVAWDLGLPQRQSTPDELRALAGRPWPGNLRELWVEIQRAYLTGGAVATARGVPAPPAVPAPPTLVPADAPPSDSPAGDKPLDEHLAEVERARIVAALRQSGGHPADAARLLGLKRTTLYYRMQKLGVPRRGVAPSDGSVDSST